MPNYVCRILLIAVVSACLLGHVVAQENKPTVRGEAAEATQVDKEVARLEAERAKIAAELKRAMEMAAIKADIARMRKELKEAKSGKVATPRVNKPAAAKGAGARKNAKDSELVLPKWLPKLANGEIKVMQDPTGMWWYVERRINDGGLMSFHSFGRGKVGKARADEFAELCRRNANHNVPKELRRGSGR